MVAVVVPIYKPFKELTENEIAALLQMRSVLSSRDIYYVCPPYIDTYNYLKILEPLNVQIIRASERYFGSLDHGNKLFLSSFLYNRLKSYKYMLIHHTDAYVFSDQLDYWCSQELDYIGAPWFVGNKEPVFPLKFKGVGNGGFSLRKVNSFLKITNNRMFINFHLCLYRFHQLLEGNHYLFLRRFLGIDLVMNIMKLYIGQEDEFWGLVVPKFYKWFNVAKPELALKFSFEVAPETLLKLNSDELPFGCHAWEKYSPDFWKAFIHTERSLLSTQ